MIEFPPQAKVGKPILKKTLAAQGVAASTLKHVLKVTWAYKLSPETITLAATSAVNEIEVVFVALADAETRDAVKQGVMAALDAAIPYPILFVFTDAAGAFTGTGLCVKPSGQKPAGGDSVAYRYALGARQFALPSSALDLEGFYCELVTRVAGMAARNGETLRAYGERLYARRSLEDQIAKLNKKRLAEKVPKNAFALTQEVQRLKKQLEGLE